MREVKTLENRKLSLKPEQIVIDGERPEGTFRGLGMKAGSGTSGLLTDYWMKFPAVYDTIVKLLFGLGSGAGLRQMHVEMGADVNALAAAEPCAMRSAQELPDVTRSASFRLAADARRINPALLLTLCRKSEPQWVTSAFEKGKNAGYEARYKWYAAVLKAAYQTFQLTFDVVYPEASEVEPDLEWVRYFAKRLKQEKNAPYDFSAIQIAVPDVDGAVSAAMLEQEDLQTAIDMIGQDEQVLLSGTDPILSRRVDGNGMTEPMRIANQIIGCCSGGQSALFSPAVGAYYGCTDCLITADAPDSGHIRINAGFWIAAQFSRFVKPGWQLIRSDAENCMALVSPDKQQLTIHLTNTNNVPRSCLIVLRELPYLKEQISFVETAGSPEDEPIDSRWFRVIQQHDLHTKDGEITFPVIIKPHSVLTITTMDTSEVCGTEELQIKSHLRGRLSLHTTDYFTYDKKTLLARGGTPCITTALGGAFEIVYDEKGSYLEQKVSAQPKDVPGRHTPEPIMVTGDALWANYQGITEGEFASDAADNFIGIGIRCQVYPEIPDVDGFFLRLYADGKWEFRYGNEVLKSDTLPEFQYNTRHKIGITVMGTLFFCFMDGHSVFETKLDDRAILRSGMVCLQSAYYCNRFYSLMVQPMPSLIPMHLECYHIDCLSPYITYVEDADGVWTLRSMTDSRFSNGTCAEGEPGAIAEIRFYGTGISLLGKAEQTHIALWLDGQLYSERYEIVHSSNREVFFALESLHEGWHTLRMAILDGALMFDSCELPTSDQWAEYDPEHFPPDPLARVEEKKHFDMKKVAIPLAGAAVAGVAIALTAQKAKRRFRRKRGSK